MRCVAHSAVRRLSLVVVGFAALGTACAGAVDVSRDEAIEVLVLDGVERQRAVCIVDGADGKVSFAKLTGVDSEIDEDELADLAAVSGACSFDVGVESSVLQLDSPDAALEIDEGGGLETDIDERIESLTSGGLARSVAECVRSAIEASSDPASALANENFIAEAIRVCDR